MCIYIFIYQLYNCLQCIHMCCIVIGKNHPNGLGSVVGTILPGTTQHSMPWMPCPQCLKVFVGGQFLCDIDIQSGTLQLKAG